MTWACDNWCNKMNERQSFCISCVCVRFHKQLDLLIHARADLLAQPRAKARFAANAISHTASAPRLMPRSNARASTRKLKDCYPPRRMIETHLEGG